LLTLISRKSEWGREQLRELVTSAPSCEDAVARLEAVMADTRPHWPDQQIIRQSEVDAGSPGPFAKYGEALSSVRVSVAEEGYQTRTTTLVTVDTEDRVTVVEQNHTQTGTRTEIQFTF